MSEPEASEQDKVIATVVLAGWTIVPVNQLFRDGVIYHVYDDNDRLVCFRSTRYTAAEHALIAMRARGLLP